MTHLGYATAKEVKVLILSCVRFLSSEYHVHPRANCKVAVGN